MVGGGGGKYSAPDGRLSTRLPYDIILIVGIDSILLSLFVITANGIYSDIIMKLLSILVNTNVDKYKFKFFYYQNNIFIL